MHDTLKNQFDRDGYVVLEDFLRPAECDELQAAGLELTKNLTESNISLYSANEPFKQHERGSRFLDSGNSIQHFYDIEALGTDAKLKVEPSKAINKAGHCLHALHPIFRCYTFSDRIKAICQQLHLVEPAVVQSSYIYKNPGVGGEVPAHQDSSYMFADPIPVIGLWIALEDTSTQTGCLSVVRGSHTSGVHLRLISNPDKNSKQEFLFDKQFPMYPQSSFTTTHIRRGTCVLLHGNVVYKSAINRSDRSSNTYTVHIIEKLNNKYSEDNWLQESSTYQFLPIYTTQQIL